MHPDTIFRLLEHFKADLPEALKQKFKSPIDEFETRLKNMDASYGGDELPQNQSQVLDLLKKQEQHPVVFLYSLKWILEYFRRILVKEIVSSRFEVKLIFDDYGIEVEKQRKFEKFISQVLYLLLKMDYKFLNVGKYMSGNFPLKGYFTSQKCRSEMESVFKILFYMAESLELEQKLIPEIESQIPDQFDIRDEYQHDNQSSQISASVLNACEHIPMSYNFDLAEKILEIVDEESGQKITSLSELKQLLPNIKRFRMSSDDLEYNYLIEVHTQSVESILEGLIVKRMGAYSKFQHFYEFDFATKPYQLIIDEFDSVFNTHEDLIQVFEYLEKFQINPELPIEKLNDMKQMKDKIIQDFFGCEIQNFYYGQENFCEILVNKMTLLKLDIMSLINKGHLSCKFDFS